LLVFPQEQFSELEAIRRDEDSLSVVADWFAIFRHAYGKDPSISFDRALGVSTYLREQMTTSLQHAGTDCTFELIHRVLLANEQGCSTLSIQRALQYFLAALPSNDAALSLLDMVLTHGYE
jgi:hypothetical protein